jgi:LmbE family N-acetylglucosaminyl deacetylase
MKIAIAGTGDLARYFYASFLHHNHTPIALTRSPKPFLDELSIEQRVTDYTVSSLTSHLSDCDAVISTISAQGQDHITAHLALLSACRLSPRCKRFIPSEWTGNIEKYPELEPRYMHETREPIRRALREQDEVMWTSVLVGWFAEYLLPVGHEGRYFGALMVGWPVDFEKRVFVLYGEGRRRVTLTSAWDVVKAVVGLLESGEEKGWEEYTHIEGETVCWRDLLAFLQAEGIGQEWTVVRREYEDAVRQVEEAEGSSELGEKVEAQLQLLGYEDFNSVDTEKARRQRETCFPGVRFRAVNEVLDEAEASK